MQSDTSMSCAHVSGVAALMWSLKPSAIAKEFKQIMLTRALLELGADGRGDFYGHVLVQVWEGIKSLTGFTTNHTVSSQPFSTPTTVASTIYQSNWLFLFWKESLSPNQSKHCLNRDRDAASRSRNCHHQRRHHNHEQLQRRLRQRHLKQRQLEQRQRGH